MDTNTKIYQIDKHKQLIPLNGATVNFSCFFEVKSRDNKPFQVAIVEQGEIKPKQWKLAENGSINGQFESDGQLKSYFLVLKAQNPCECNVQIIVKAKESPQIDNQLPQSTSQLPPPQYSTLVDGVGQPDPNYVKTGVELSGTTLESYFQLNYILGISAAIIVVYLLYRYRKSIFGNFAKESPNQVSISNSSF